MAAPTPSQKYLSTRGGSHDLPFEQTILKGLASDRGLFLPHHIPTLPPQWAHEWRNLSFAELAVKIFRLYIAEEEIAEGELEGVVRKSYHAFRVGGVVDVVELEEGRKGREGREGEVWLLELFHGPTFAFKDVALQFLGNLFEFFLVRRNKHNGVMSNISSHNHDTTTNGTSKEGQKSQKREHLTVVGATSGDTGSAAIYGLRSKKDVSVFILYPTGKVSPTQEAQMTTVPDGNVHCLSVDGTFDDCQDFVKGLFADSKTNDAVKLGAVNSINWARILAQITYYFYCYFDLQRKSIIKSPHDRIRFVVPTGNFGDILAGYFAKRMGLPVEKLVVATNANDILHRFWQTGSYEKDPVHGDAAKGGLPEDGAKADPGGVKETYSPAMDILVSSNFERLLWYLAYDVYGSATNSIPEKQKTASSKVLEWQTSLSTRGGFTVEPKILAAARQDFTSERVSDEETLATIRDTHRKKKYILDPHSAIGVTAALRSDQAVEAAAKTSASNCDVGNVHTVSLATAHPAKFSNAVELALKDEKDFTFEEILPEEFKGLDQLPKRFTLVKKSDGLEGIRELIIDRVRTEIGIT